MFLEKVLGELVLEADFLVLVLGVEVLRVEEVVAFLERRETKPSIDLFLSIDYNYNIWRLS